MLNIQADCDLRQLNTFGIGCVARHYVAVKTDADLVNALMFANDNNLPVRILGGGSNVLFTTDFIDAVVVHIQIKGIEVVKETEKSVCVRVGAGVVWHDFVLHCLAQNWGGTENLALIYGTVGAAPMQNIGAYGVEIKDICKSVTGYHLHKKSTETIPAAQCHFGYRNSIFKNELKGAFIITHVDFELQKPPHTLHTNYAGVAQSLPPHPTIQQVAAAIIHLRQTKLPNPSVVGNAGSFFKNPVVDSGVFEKLQANFTDITGYKTADNHIKLSAAWLIEQCGYKGWRTGNAGIYAHHALVLVNHGGAQGADIWALAQQIQAAVHLKFGINLLPEVNIWD